MELSELKKKAFHFLENEDETCFQLDDMVDFTYSKEKKGTGKANCSNIYYPERHDLNSKAEKIEGFLEIPMSSKYDFLCLACKYYKNKDFLGERKRELVDGKVVHGPYVFKTYGEIKNEIEVFASALCQCENIEPCVFDDNGKINKLKILGIWSKNRIEWLITDFACSAVDFVTVPLYDTMGINSVKYIFEKTKMKMCCIESGKLENLINIKNELAYLKFLIIYDEWNINEDLVKKAESVGYKVYYYKNLIDKFKKKNIVSELYADENVEELNGNTKKEGNKKKNAERDEPEDGRIDNGINSLSHKKSKIRKMTVETVGDNKSDAEKTKSQQETSTGIDYINEQHSAAENKKAMNDIMKVESNNNSESKNIPTNLKHNSGDAHELSNSVEEKKVKGSCEGVNSVSDATALKRRASDSSGKGTYSFTSRIRKPRARDVCSIVFTSGSTGIPKGVMLSHLNFLCFIQSYIIDGNRLGIMKYDSILSYLPLAHVYERYIEYAVCFFGVKIGYFSGNVKDILEDINALKPTFLIAVPRILQKIYDNIIQGLKTKSFLARMLVKTAIRKKKNLYLKNSTKFCHGFYDLILQPIRNKFGGALRIQVMGSSSMDETKLIDLQMIFSTPISEGWGMSEVGIGFLQNRFDNNKGTIGGAFSNVLMKVSKVDQMKYDPKGRPNQGELCVKGSGVMLGYFRDVELTKKSFDSDGFFLTGDIAEIGENGCVKIIDRAKNIFKLAQGEYIEPEKLENIYLDSVYVDQIFVHGYSYESEVVSIIVPSQINIMEYAKKNNLSLSFEELLKSPEINKLIADELNTVSEKYKLNGIERVRLFHLTPTSFSVDNKQLTPTHKVVRSTLVEDYKNVIEDLYKNGKTLK